VFERLLNQPPYSLKQADKEPVLLEGLNELTRYHCDKSPEYKRIIDAAWGGLKTYGSIAEVPYLPVSLFKEMELKSTALPAMVMRSSGTTGQRTSRIIIDNETARRQSEALVASFRPILGSRRLPFLAIDTKDVIKPTDLTARGGVVLGMMKFGAKTAFGTGARVTAAGTGAVLAAATGRYPSMPVSFLNSGTTRSSGRCRRVVISARVKVPLVRRTGGPCPTAQR